MAIMDFIRNFFFNMKVKAALNKHGQADPRDAAYEYLRKKLEKSLKENDMELLNKVLDVFMKRLTIAISNSIKDAEDKKMIHSLLTIKDQRIINRIKDFIRDNAVIAPLVEVLRELIPNNELLEFLDSILDTEDTLFNEDLVAKRIEILKYFEGTTFPAVLDKAIAFLDDSDDNLVIASIRFFKEYEFTNEEEEKKVLKTLLEKFVDEETSARIRMEILDVFVANDWSVSGHKKEVEEILSDKYYLTSKGKIRKKG